MPDVKTTSTSPEGQLAELAEMEARIRQEIAEREQILAGITARKLKAHETMKRAGIPQPGSNMRLPETEISPAGPGGDSILTPYKSAAAHSAPPTTPGWPGWGAPLPPDPDEMVRGPDGLVLPRRLRNR